MPVSLLALAALSSAFAATPKVDVCHRGAVNNIATAAVAAHVAHGDWVVAAESCNGIDDDCDGTVDEAAVDAGTWYADADIDGYGDEGNSMAACTAPAGFVADGSDCDDLAADVNPGATEVCNSVDDDCDGSADLGAADAGAWYADGDEDTYGDAAAMSMACEAPVGSVADDSDCDDTSGEVNPAATEVCNGEDDDCDETVDLGAVDMGTWYADVDGDGYGDATESATACEVGGYVSDAQDCDDGDIDVNPGAPEVRNGLDDNCDGLVDEGVGPSPGPHAASTADTVITGAVANDYLGMAAFGAAGDFDGDGADDLAVASGFARSTDAGAVWVFGHDPAGGSVTTADATWTGAHSGDLAGYGGIAAGDFDGDGSDELAVGAPRNPVSHGYWTGAVHILGNPMTGGGSLSAASATIAGEAYEDLAGGDVANLGDWDGDGTDDLLVGAMYSEQGASYGGAGYVVEDVLGGVSSLSARSLELFGQGTYDRLGQSVAGVDLNGDGFGDALVGSYGYLSGGTGYAAGGVVAVYGPDSGAIGASSADVEWKGDTSTAYLGAYKTVRNGGDIDGDGNDDVILGAYDGGYGVVFVVLGGSVTSGTIGTVADAALYGEASGDGAGQSLDAAGDVDADGFGDLLVGASAHGTSGRAYLALGPLSGTSYLADTIVFDGEAAGDSFGAVMSAGDQDGDGLPDLLIGASQSDLGTTNAGAAYLFYASSL